MSNSLGINNVKVHSKHVAGRCAYQISGGDDSARPSTPAPSTKKAELLTP